MLPEPKERRPNHRRKPVEDEYKNWKAKDWKRHVDDFKDG